MAATAGVDKEDKDDGDAELKRIASLPWIEKYRPQHFDEIISQATALQIIIRLAQKNELPHLLLQGSPGTGKTSTVLALARFLYGANIANMVLMLNASDENGIEAIRTQVKEFVATKPMFQQKANEFKLVILDEADAITKDAQMALRGIIEHHTTSARFCLTVNYPHKLLPAIQSRCYQLRFAPLQDKDVIERIKFVEAKENLPLADDGRVALIHLAKGDMRKILNMFQSCERYRSNNGKLISGDMVYRCTGMPSPRVITEILDVLLSGPMAVAYATLSALQSKGGYGLTDIITELHLRILHDNHLSSQILGSLLDGLSNIEHRLAAGGSESVNLGSLVAVFITAINRLQKQNMACDTKR
jgi:replication factor C subunit 3/5